MSTQTRENVVGALIFYAYIAGALALTGLICRDLMIMYNRFSGQKRKDVQVLRKDCGRAKRGTQSRVSILAALSALSFAVLSYHMLNFLIQSYQSWAPSESLSDVSFPKIWKWSVHSRLFRDFAEAIINDPHRFWWTNLALTYSLGWNVYMSIEGFRKSIPHLWAYFLLDQILPVSFTQNMFLLAVHLQDDKKYAEIRMLDPPSAAMQVLLVCAYSAVLATAPISIGSGWFIWVLLATRALLSAPFLVLRPRIARPGASFQHQDVFSSANYSLRHEARWALALISGYMAVQLAQGFLALPSSITAVLSVLHDNPAVSTLGYDLLIGTFSLSVSRLSAYQ
ncbi:hypothetical protein A1O7_00461 [Cladophialophora yegresii CBS 114405]|uniref:Uncharacterized protein n=1 Tax=Cladophialophora yegresii CBS 114405 TaxID=1182544 RepID=W9WGK3_9EURO|nr:uncharacterized protein A1O7_00461 [Cladophialophora yegresii CBS 114405]EXJ64125.1 hypothetical protein A1O7_00461 [Cladophialophora yegresii CBS 114405]